MKTINELLYDAQQYLSDMKKKRRMNKAVKTFNEKVLSEVERNTCAAKLGDCQRSFNRTIKSESEAIRKGQAQGFDVPVQKRLLRDAAIGYLLVRDARFAIDSIASYDSVEHAYDLLEGAIDFMSHKSPSLGSKIASFFTTKTRNEYGYLTSEESVRQKCQRVDDADFFNMLIQTGDIEACLEAVKLPMEKESERRAAGTGVSGGTKYAERPDYPEMDYDTMMGLTKPVAQTQPEAEPEAEPTAEPVSQPVVEETQPAQREAEPAMQVDQNNQ